MLRTPAPLIGALERSFKKQRKEHMDYLGLLALGGFVGAIVTYGLKFIDGFSSFAQAITIILDLVRNLAGIFGSLSLRY